MRGRYWLGWKLLVRHYRRAGEAEAAEKVLGEMEERLLRLQRQRDPLFARAAAILLGLYAEGQQVDRVHAALDRLRSAGGKDAEVARLEADFKESAGQATSGASRR